MERTPWSDLRTVHSDFWLCILALIAAEEDELRGSSIIRECFRTCDKARHGGPPATMSTPLAAFSRAFLVADARWSPQIAAAAGKLQAYVAIASRTTSTPATTVHPDCWKPSEVPPAPQYRSTMRRGGVPRMV